MELTINVPDAIKPLLEKRAAEQGQDVKTFVEAFIQLTVYPALNLPRFDETVSESEFESELNAFSDGTENVEPYSGTYSREDIYFDHD